MFGMRLLSSFSAQSLSRYSPRKRSLSVDDDDVAADALPLREPALDGREVLGVRVDVLVVVDLDPRLRRELLERRRTRHAGGLAGRRRVDVELPVREVEDVVQLAAVARRRRRHRRRPRAATGTRAALRRPRRVAGALVGSAAGSCVLLLARASRPGRRRTSTPEPSSARRSSRARERALPRPCSARTRARCPRPCGRRPASPLRCRRSRRPCREARSHRRPLRS